MRIVIRVVAHKDWVHDRVYTRFNINSQEQSQKGGNALKVDGGTKEAKAEGV